MEEFTKINMEKMAGGFDRNSLVMSIADIKDIDCHAIQQTKS